LEFILISRTTARQQADCPASQQ